MLSQKRNLDKEKCSMNESSHVITISDEGDNITKKAIHEKKQKIKEIIAQSQVTYQEELNNKIFLSAYWRVSFDPSRTKLPISTIIQEKRTKYEFHLSFQKNKTSNNYYNFIFSNDINNSSFSLSNDDHFEIRVNVHYKGVVIKKCNFILINDPSSHNEKIYIPHNQDDKIDEEDIPSIVFCISVDIGTKASAVSPYSGLINEGSTCYLNSMLQLLYMIPLFTKNILMYNTEKDTKLSSLQNVFKELELLNNSEHSIKLPAVSANDFISSFGWTREQKKIQHDIQEFFMNLAETIETEIKKSPSTVDNTPKKEKLSKFNIFKYLFEGKITTTIKCVNVPILSSKEETFFDIQLVVKGCKDINESFANFTMNELLNGVNKYDTGKYGKQDAKKSVKFTSLPKVFLIQLKRFEYNVEYKEMEKINAKFKYYPIIDLSPYTKKNLPTCKVYHCYTVVVHSGNINGGHYYAYIKNKDKLWYKFNDENVDIAYDYEVFDNNYGGDSLNYTFNETNNTIRGHKCGISSNAYILMYVREDCIDELYLKKKHDDFNIEIEDDENLFKDVIIKAKREIKVYVFSKEVVIGASGFGLLYDDYQSFEKVQSSLVLLEDVGYYDTMEKIVMMISKETGVPVDLLDFYEYNTISNYYYKYNGRYIERDDYKKTIQSLFEKVLENKDCISFYIHVNNQKYTLMEYNAITKKWNLKKNIVNDEESVTKEKKKLFVIKYVIISYVIPKKCLSTRLVIDTVLSVSNTEQLKEQLAKLKIKETFFNRYYSDPEYNYNILIESDMFNENYISFISENPHIFSHSSLTKPFDDSKVFNSGSINDIECLIVNLNFRKDWNEKSFISFSSFEQVIENTYKLFLPKIIKIVNDKNIVQEVSVNFDQNNFDKDFIMSIIDDQFVKEGFYYFIAYNKIENFIYDICLDDNISEFKRIIKTYRLKYDLMYQHYSKVLNKSKQKVKKIFASFFIPNSKESFTLPYVFFVKDQTLILDLKNDINKYLKSQTENEHLKYTVYKSYLDNNTLIRDKKIDIDNVDEINKKLSDVINEEKSYIYIEVKGSVKNHNGNDKPNGHKSFELIDISK